MFAKSAIAGDVLVQTTYCQCLASNVQHQSQINTMSHSVWNGSIKRDCPLHHTAAWCILSKQGGLQQHFYLHVRLFVKQLLLQLWIRPDIHKLSLRQIY